MKSEKLQDAIGEVKDSLILDAETEAIGKRNGWIRWAAAAAAVVLVLTAGILYISGVIGRKANPDEKSNAVTEQDRHDEQSDAAVEQANPDTQSEAAVEQGSSEEQSDAASEQDHSGPAVVFSERGIDAELVENPAEIAVNEMPYISREEAVRNLNSAKAVLECTVEEISRIRVSEPGSDSVWFITTMTLSMNRVIRGNTEEERFRVVNAAVTNMPVDFFYYPGLEECREQMRAVFTLRELSDTDVWTIGDQEISVKELGDYSVISCLGFDGTNIQYQNYSIPLTELEN